MRHELVARTPLSNINQSIPWVEREKTLNCTYLQKQTPQHLQLTPSLALWDDMLSRRAFRDHHRFYATFFETFVHCNPDLVTLDLVTTCDLVSIFQRPFFNLLR